LSEKVELVEVYALSYDLKEEKAKLYVEEALWQ
jgi:hypothetical protein